MPIVTPAFRIFIVEDNEWYGQLLAYRLNQNPDYTVTRFASAQECLSQLAQKPDLISLDYGLPDMAGDEVFRRIKVQLPDVAVVVISAQEDVRTAISLLRQGAYDYLVKDEDTPDRLWHVAGNVQRQVTLRRENEQLRQQLGQATDPRRTLLGCSPQMQQLQGLIEKAARTNISVSLTGETGTGKELVAKAIHALSEQRTGAFVAVNVAAIPRELLESELFGHEKGAFTGAVSRRVGRFEEAHQGTLFLDEIADLDFSLQSKLLRALQEREVYRVGGNSAIRFDARLIVATHHDLAERVRQGAFREDLFYRLLGLPIALPPLRERGDDVLLLAKAFLRDFATRNNLAVHSFSPAACLKLQQYAFPGNVRELKAVVELGAVLAEGDTVEPVDLQLRPTSPAASPETAAPLRAQVASIVQRCLDANQGNILQAAAQLCIGKSTLYRMLQNKEVYIK
ncbi:sigma-54-dependent transcriptional regulator [Hymenobacter guriensis]|uniref:Sigma-54-dependent Fis family transcriptional regulator n=1 Tax=Hymenobacter guriensis TaxID=2793065 RepID=A0ABS0L4M5_9BACT|nr:sigma-54 dependent transcriptional regulator [Hymenobacter guriensis]MBG8554327.1 sigma-54-dependent Fis family transcriptional regulator [Hymenobacter guriensis]